MCTQSSNINERHIVETKNQMKVIINAYYTTVCGNEDIHWRILH